MKNCLFVFFVLLLTSSAFADVIKMKNGDVYHAEILRQEFGSYVQILLKDGSEKRLPASDVDSIEKNPTDTTAAQIPPSQNLANTPTTSKSDSESGSDQYPSEMLDPHGEARFDLDLVAFSYDATWQNAAIGANGGSSTTLNTSNHYVRTAPEEFTLRAYIGNWHAYLDFLNSAVNSNDINDQSFSTVAVTYSLARNFDLGVMALFSYATTTSSSTASTTITGSDYGIGPFFRLVTPMSERSAFEISGGVGLDFRNLTIATGSASLNGSDAALVSTVRMGASISLFKNVSYLFWVDGWFDIGTLSGTFISGGTGVAGSLQENIYRLRVVPVGLRLKF